jgi:hypothetical protein
MLFIVSVLIRELAASRNLQHSKQMSSARLFDGQMLANKIKASVKQVQYVLSSILVPVSMVVSIRIRLPYSHPD